MKDRKGINNTHLKNRNRGLVLQWVAGEDRLSRIDIAKRIGLTKMAVTNIVNELITEQYIEEKEIAETLTIGRNPVMLDIAASAPKAIGLYLSRSELSVLISDLKLNIIFRDSCDLSEETKDSLIKKLFSLVDRAMTWFESNHPGGLFLGIGVSAIGPLDSRTGTILSPTNFFGIRNVPIVSLLRDRYGLAVFLNNDMNASALAEKLYGHGKPYNNFVYLGISNGIGSGIVSGGKLYQDNSGFVGEIGHLSIDFNGDVCSCGNRGCLEVYANMPIVIDKLCEAMDGASVTFADFERITAIPACQAVFENMIRKLSIALINVVNLLDPQCIIIGHEGVYIPEIYRARLSQLVNAHILAAEYRNIPVVPSSFGKDAPLLGSVCCVWQKLFDGYLSASGEQDAVM